MGLRDQTAMGGSSPAFPPTRWTLIRQARDRNSSECRVAFEELGRLYWKPVHAYICAGGRVRGEEVKDVTQEFFLHWMEGSILSNYEPGRGSFRSYLRGAVEFFLANLWRKQSALKRGGGNAILSLSEEDWRELAVPSEESTPDGAFDRAWGWTVMEHAVHDLKRELAGDGKDAYFRVFERSVINPPAEGPPTYAQLAVELGLKEGDVNNYLSYCRRRLRQLLTERVRETVEAEDDVGPELERVFRAARRPGR